MTALTRPERAFVIRNHLLSVVRERGTQERPGSPGRRVPSTMWSEDKLKVAFYDPVTRMAVDAVSTSPASSMYRKMLAEELASPNMLPYGLDVWTSLKVIGIKWEKVMSVQWSDYYGPIDLISFRSGDWERIALSA